MTTTAATTNTRTTLPDLLDPAALAAAVEEGLVRVQTSPDGALRIHNYTEQAVWTRAWTPVTRACRGLVVDAATQEVVARPWPKFFNHGEPAAGALDLGAAVEVTDKADGSLGILSRAGDGRPAVATRGSFGSDQARHATAVYRDRYAGAWAPAEGWTHLFEIVYPANRIVLDYAGLDDLLLLGAVHVATGELAGPHDPVVAGWPGPRVEAFAYSTLAEALAAPPRPNAEGLVVRYLGAAGGTGAMVKIKQADYLAVHRLVTGLTARRLWERAAVWSVLADAPDLPHRRLAQALRLDAADLAGIVDAGPGWRDDVARTAPEEFTDWIRATTDRLETQVHELVAAVDAEAGRWRGRDRREVAAAVTGLPHRGLVFAALDGKPFLAQAWSALRPASERPFTTRSEDVA